MTKITENLHKVKYSGTPISLANHSINTIEAVNRVKHSPVSGNLPSLFFSYSGEQNKVSAPPDHCQPNRRIDFDQMLEIIQSEPPEAFHRIRETIQQMLKAGRGWREIKKAVKADKESLPWFLFSGHCEIHHKARSLEYNSCVQVDIDFKHKGGHLLALEIKDELKRLPYVKLACISPSGYGVKALVPTFNRDKKTHAQAAKQVIQAISGALEIEEEYFDSLSLSQPCFAPYDRQPYFAEEAGVFEVMDAPEQGSVAEFESLAAGIKESEWIPFAEKYAEKKGCAFEDGQKHRYFVFFSIACNLLGVPQKKVYDYAADRGVEIHSNCISGPYRRYQENFGRWAHRLEENKRAAQNGVVENAANCIAQGLYEKDGRYQKRSVRDDGDKWIPITNFVMRGLYLVKGNKPVRIIHFKAVHGESDTIPVSVDSLTADGLGKLIKGLGNFSAKWSKNQFEDILLHACRNQQKAETCDYLGHLADDRGFAFANGLLFYDDNQFYPVNEHGIAETPSGAYHILQYKNESEPMTYKEGVVNFRQYFELLSQAFGQNGEAGAAIVLAYAFSDILFRETRNIFLLFLAGKRETGKTSFADCLRAPFFYKKPATVNLKSNSTVKSRYRMLAKYSNGVVVFDEFTDVPKNTNILVTQYNRDGYSRAATSNDNEVLETPVRANSLFIGNYLPESEPAAMSRLIILPFKKCEDKEKQKRLAAYRELSNGLRQGSGGLLREILKLRREVEKEYASKFAGLMATQSLMERVTDTRDAEKVAAIMAVLQICWYQLGLTLEEVTRIEEYLMLQLRDQKSLVDATDHTSQFFTEISLLIEDGVLTESTHFAFSDDRTEVVFKFNACYRKAQESAIKQRRTLAGKAMLLRLLKEHGAFIRGGRSANERIKRGGMLAHGFEVDKLPEDIREVLMQAEDEFPV